MSKRANNQESVDLSRRGLFKTATYMVGGATALLATGESSIAHVSDVVMDSSGRVALNGVIYGKEQLPSTAEHAEDGVKLAANCLNTVCRSKAGAASKAAKCANVVCRSQQSRQRK